MLALTRKIGESIIINDNIQVCVIGIQGEQVKLGVIAPKDVTIHREEVFQLIQKENMEAVEMTDIGDLKKWKQA